MKQYVVVAMVAAYSLCMTGCQDPTSADGQVDTLYVVTHDTLHSIDTLFLSRADTLRSFDTTVIYDSLLIYDINYDTIIVYDIILDTVFRFDTTRRIDTLVSKDTTFTFDTVYRRDTVVVVDTGGTVLRWRGRIRTTNTIVSFDSVEGAWTIEWGDPIDGSWIVQMMVASSSTYGVWGLNAWIPIDEYCVTYWDIPPPLWFSDRCVIFDSQRVIEGAYFDLLLYKP